MGDHGTEYCHVQGMSGEIILPASQILVEIDFFIQMSVIADDHICDGLGTVLLSGLQDTILFLFMLISLVKYNNVNGVRITLNM